MTTVIDHELGQDVLGQAAVGLCADADADADGAAGAAGSSSMGWDTSGWSFEEVVAYVRLSPAQRALVDIGRSLGELGLPVGVAEDLVAVLTCAAAVAGAGDEGGTGGTSGRNGPGGPFLPTEGQLGDGAVLRAVEGVRGVQGFADSVLVGASRVLARRAGAELLGRKGVTDPAELSATARERWRARSKSAVAQEVAVLTGYGVQACHSRVGFAVAPRAAVGVVDAALASGACDWRAVGEFWSRCGRMAPEEAGLVADEVFGPLLAQKTCKVPDSDDDSGDESGDDARRESWAEFRRRLEREAVRVEGVDAARARRRERVAERNVWGFVGDDGLGQVTASAGTTSVVAALERIETLARRAKKAGDGRPLGQIRSDAVMALLVHGTLPIGQGCPDELVPMDEDTRRVLAGLPAASVEVIVPVGVFGQIIPADPPAATPGAAEDQPVADGAARAAETHTREDRRTDGRPGAPGGGGRCGLVAEITGYGFLTPEHVAEILAAPGTTLHRLLTDPADGRLVERSITAYRPDAAMITQVRAADVFCRAPGCLVPARRCDLDHEDPHGTGGPTAEVNLNDKHRPHHQVKTEQLWATMMDATRTVTWTTLFGRVHTTRGHDYRQYGPPPTGPDPATPDQVVPDEHTPRGSTPDGSGPEVSAAGESTAPPQDPFTVTDPDLRDRLVYAALTTRGTAGQPDSRLEGHDDYDTDLWTRGYDRPLNVFHRTGARRRHGPPPGQPTPTELLAPPPPPPPPVVPEEPPF